MALLTSVVSSPTTHDFCLQYFCFSSGMPLCTLVAQASVYVLVHHAKHHMDTYMRRGVLGSVCVCMYSVCVYFASGIPFLYRVLRVQASTAVQPFHSTHVHFSSPLTQHYPVLCLYRQSNTSISMHIFASLKHGSRTHSSTTSRLDCQDGLSGRGDKFSCPSHLTFPNHNF